jgi:hypothetical protein
MRKLCINFLDTYLYSERKLLSLQTKQTKMKKTITLLLLAISISAMAAIADKPRIIISTDIGGTDPDDNQSMIHLLMFNDMFDIEGIISSPSFGNGSKEEILRMIDLYEKDYPQLHKQYKELRSPKQLRRLCKQGRRGLASYRGYSNPTEGSEWIVKCARKKSQKPLYVLVWGTTEDLAQALHDAPDIVDKIRVYYIGGPNKKWGVNSYAYIAQNFPLLHMIECNASYRGFITDNRKLELIEEFNGKVETNDCYGEGFYNYAMRGHGAMAAAFSNWYKGIVKMGDTPSLLYMMNGNPENPEEDSWGGRFYPITRSSRHIITSPMKADKDTVPVYSVMEFHFLGPIADIPEDSICFIITIANQKWNGYYNGDGDYVVRYSPKTPALLTYKVESAIKELNGMSGSFIVSDTWPGHADKNDYKLGPNWFSDMQEREYFEGEWQGAKTVRKHRNEVLELWASRFRCLARQSRTNSCAELAILRYNEMNIIELFHQWENIFALR